MNWMVVYLIALTAALAVSLGWVGWVLLKRTPKEFPCYRCGGLASAEYMGLHYCGMCRQVVMAMISAVQHDPPYGFPGAQGYLEFPGKEPK